MSATTPVTRRREQVDREYGEEKWPAMERVIEAEIAREPDACLGRTLRRAAASQWRDGAELDACPFVVGGTEVALPPGGAYGAAQGVVLDAIAAATTPETDLVVEMGSGFGWHILSAWTDGGPREATYVAAEYTAAGRRAASRLAALDDRLRFRAVAFDYHDPHFDDLPEARHAVVFSVHSVEQIPHVPAVLVDAIRALADRVTCVHFEPVAWQLDPEHDGRGTSVAYAEQHDYTRDLVPVLRAAEASGAISIDALMPDVFGVNARNSTTLIRWTTAR